VRRLCSNCGEVNLNYNELFAVELFFVVNK